MRQPKAMCKERSLFQPETGTQAACCPRNRGKCVSAVPRASAEEHLSAISLQRCRHQRTANQLLLYLCP